MTGPVDEPPNVLYRGQSYLLEQTIGFDRWLRTLRDREGQLRIRKRLVRLSNGHFGDCKSVGTGVHELRMFFGPGYRIYFARRGDIVILLLAGGDKDSQADDIVRAKALTEEFDDGNKNDPL
jgi:putative addiction module killer protein